MSNKIITTLYEHYKNTPKKLKIVCDWDEVIQAAEPYALWKSILEQKQLTEAYIPVEFTEYFKNFWKANHVKYSPYGSKLEIDKDIEDSILGVIPSLLEKQQEIKNSPDFYQQAPFLTIAEDLLKLIKEDKVERLIFLSAYDKRKFPVVDGRKIEIFHKTFNPVKVPDADKLKKNDFPKMAEMTFDNIEMKLIPFESETQGQTKADWIKEHAPNFDLVIDDNPNICSELVKESVYFNIDMEVFAPYYPAIENQHHSEVLLVKQEVSALRKEDFSKWYGNF